MVSTEAVAAAGPQGAKRANGGTVGSTSNAIGRDVATAEGNHHLSITLLVSVAHAGAVNPTVRFWRSTIGKKMVMAVTGIIMIGFVVGHVLGNLLVFRGPEKLNSYAAFLRGAGGALWIARLVLLASVILHVVAAVQLTRLQRLARPTGYDRKDPQVSTFAARTIRWGGLLIFFFVVLHLLHFTTGTLHPSFNHTDVYANMISAFRTPWISALYIVAMAALGLHLYHGTWSSLRTLGMNRASRDPLKRRAAALLAAAVWLGFTIIPVAILAGFPS